MVPNRPVSWVGKVEEGDFGSPEKDEQTEIHPWRGISETGGGGKMKLDATPPEES